MLRFKRFKGFVKAGIERAKQIRLASAPPTIKRAIYRMTNFPDMVESWARFSVIDWTQTQAYSEETPYFPSIWINLKGREPLGLVDPHEYETVRDPSHGSTSAVAESLTGQTHDQAGAPDERSSMLVPRSSRRPT